MKKRYALAFLLTALAGTALHFAYDWCLSPLVGLFAPVNESVWEHLKLLFWPFLAAGFALTHGQAEKPAAKRNGKNEKEVAQIVCTASFRLNTDQ